jgi:hypothetical protein
MQETRIGTAPLNRHLERFEREAAIVDGADRPPSL